MRATRVNAVFFVHFHFVFLRRFIFSITSYLINSVVFHIDDVSEKWWQKQRKIDRTQI